MVGVRDGHTAGAEQGWYAGEDKGEVHMEGRETNRWPPGEAQTCCRVRAAAGQRSSTLPAPAPPEQRLSRRATSISRNAQQPT